MPLLGFVALHSSSSLWLGRIANAVSWQKRRRIYYACMGIIVNWVIELHLKHAYFPRIGSQIDLLKELLFCKTMSDGLMCQGTQRDRGHVTGGQTGNQYMRQCSVATDVFMAKRDDKIVFKTKL